VNDLAQKVSNPSFFERKDGDIVLGLSRCHPATQPTTHRRSGVDIIYEDKRLQPVIACIFTDEDVQLAAPPGLSQHVALLQVFSRPSTWPLPHLKAVTTSTSTLLSLGPVQPSEPTHIGRLQIDFESSCETGTYPMLCGAALHPTCLSIHMIRRPVLTALTLTALTLSPVCTRQT
jgi:hypothetical protein